MVAKDFTGDIKQVWGKCAVDPSMRRIRLNLLPTLEAQVKHCTPQLLFNPLHKNDFDKYQ